MTFPSIDGGPLNQGRGFAKSAIQGQPHATFTGAQAFGRTGAYSLPLSVLSGRCVYYSDNDVCNYLTFALGFEGGVMASHLAAFAAEESRKTGQVVQL